MFDINLAQLFGTIGVGVIVAMLIAYFYFLFCKLFYVKMYNRDAFIEWFKGMVKIEFSKTGYGLVCGLLVYGLGLLAQDITEHTRDSDNNQQYFVRIFKGWLLETETELRKQTLMDDSKINFLGREILDNKDMLKYAGVLHDTLNDDNVNRLYFAANNWFALRHPAIKEDLKAIQNRIDFAKSLVVLCSLAFMLVIVFFIVYFCIEFSKPAAKRFKVLCDNKLEDMWFYPRRSLIILLPIIVGYICYEGAEINYNERVFGYFSSYIKQVHTPDSLMKAPVIFK